ncbi:MAG: hypothetical protein ABII13_00460 [Patescibacteria group bacterium]|nr:hypothetical protein [Patescibacteria group bacterium]MBU2509494.1 hypothetical protein [Patescibacteria group bacterium]
MPLIQIWKWGQGGKERSSSFPGRLIDACFEIKELGFSDPHDITVVYAGENNVVMSGDPLIIIVEMLFEKPERTPEVRQRLAKSLGKAVKKVIDPRLVEVVIKRFNPEDGFWKG